MEECPQADLSRSLLRNTERSEIIAKAAERSDGIAKAAWQLEDALNGRLVKDYPSDRKAREAYFQWASADQLYGTSLALLYILSMVEVPAWCDTTSNFWSFMDSSERCFVPGVKAEDLLLSNVPYLPPGWSLIVEAVLVYQIGVKLLQERSLQVQHFSPMHVAYFGENNNKMIAAGLAMVAFEVVDMVAFILWRQPLRLAFIPRTAFMVLLPQVLNLFSSIASVIQEFVTIAVFFASGIFMFAWIATMLFDGVEGEIYGEPVIAGLDSFGHSVNTMFVAGATDDFFEMFRNSYTLYRTSGLLWLTFLVIVHVLLLSLVLDTLVSAYTKLTEENEEEGNKDKADGIKQAFETLLETTGEGTNLVSKETFLEFASEFSKSPTTIVIPMEQALIIFAKVHEDETEVIDRKEFFALCAAMQLKFTVTIKDSPVKDALPWLWDHPAFAQLRIWIEDKSFDNWFMNVILMINLSLVVIETTYDLNHVPEASYCKQFELIFSFIYVTECGLKLCVWSWDEYHSVGANTFDFVTTWLLLGSSVLEEVANGAVGIKRYMNVLRLLRLVRVIKQLKKIPQVIFMISTITRLVTEAKHILTLLLVVMYFFTMLSVQLFGGLLYKTHPALKESEYSEADFWVLNFNDFLMAFGVWVVMLLCEYKAEFTDAIARTSRIPLSWTVFFIFYVFAVSIIFELVKAFTIEVFVTLHREAHEKKKEKELMKAEKLRERALRRSRMETEVELSESSESEAEEFEGLKDLQEQYKLQGKALHCQLTGDPRQKDKIAEALEEMEKEEREEEEKREEESCSGGSAGLHEVENGNK